MRRLFFAVFFAAGEQRLPAFSCRKSR